jgi:hypothetical protein
MKNQFNPDKVSLKSINGLSFDQLAKEYDILIDYWNSIKNQGDFPLREFTDSLIMETVTILKRCKRKYDQFGHITLINTYLILAKRHLSEGSLTPALILVDTKAGDQIRTFTKIIPYLNDKEYWELLAQAYITQEYSSVNAGMIWSLFNTSLPKQENLMSNEERAYLERLPETFTIYRAMSVKESKSKMFRFSWSLDKNIAIDFAHRNKLIYRKETVVEEITAQKKFVIAYLNKRDEEEIIYDYSKSIGARS